MRIPEVRFPQIVLFESDRKLISLLAPLASRNGWLLREPRRIEAASELLANGGPNVLIVRCGRDLDREITLLDRTTRTSPATCSIVIIERDYQRLVSLAWDLGARFVITPDQAREYLTELLELQLRVEG